MEGERWRESDSERETCWYIHHLLSLDVAAVHAFSPRAHMSGMLCGSSPMSTDIQFIHMILDCNSRRQQLIMNSFIKEQLANKFGAGMHPALLRPDGESMHHALSPTHAGGAGMHLAPPPPHPGVPCPPTPAVPAVPVCSLIPQPPSRQCRYASH